MKLPDGVFYRPRQERLIAKDEPAFVRIETGPRYPGNDGYEIKDRSFDNAIAPQLKGDWEDFDRLFRLNSRRVVSTGDQREESSVIYSGAEHRGDPKLPNITVVPNLNIKEPRGLSRPYTMFGCTMGHFHPEKRSDRRIQEVYEFQSYGMLVLDRENGEVELWVARQGDKVAVPGGCHMTLYNLGNSDNPLVTLDFADPHRNPSNKDLVRQCGPILLGYYDDVEVVFRLNRLYINNSNHNAGVHLRHAPSREQDREIKIALGARLDLGALLYEQLIFNQEVIGRFAPLGLFIKEASPEAMLEPLPPGRGMRLYFSRSLVDAIRAGTDVYRYFFPDVGKAQPGLPKGRGIAQVESDIAEEKKRLIQLGALNRALVIVVEGAGDWVENAYRSLFKKLVGEGRWLSVYYADDTRWKPRPKWAGPPEQGSSLEPWETYLDKADSDEFAIYRNLRPDVVFIVTPDFTHSAIARWWLGKTPLVFIEKPFDSQLSNVEDMLREMGRTRGTAIFGLDHYQFYALPVHKLKSEIVEHLGGVLARTEFFMTEDRPVELDRVRTLQYGLSLDLLPHFLALLTYFGDVGTLDEIRVIESRQYHPLIGALRPDFSPDDVKDANRLLDKLFARQDALSRFLLEKMSEPTKMQLNDYDPTQQISRKLLEAISKELNCVIQGGVICEPQRFPEVILATETRRLRAQNPQSVNLIRLLNRWFLEDAYPDEIAKSRRDISGLFANETYSRVCFTFQDYSGNGFHIPCLAAVGKGLSQGVKYLEVTGPNGNGFRMDLNKKPDPDPAPSYPWDSLFFLQGDQESHPAGMQVRDVADPYDPQRILHILFDPNDAGRFCRPLERERYKKLLEDLLDGNGTAVAGSLLLTEAYDIVRGLDRIWWAAQAEKPWSEHIFGELNPIRPRLEEL